MFKIHRNLNNSNNTNSLNLVPNYENTSPINQGTFPYSRGFAVQGSFVTIMGESSNNGGVARLPPFSSPEYYCAGFTCGVPDEVDAIRSIKNVYEQIANYRN